MKKYLIVLLSLMLITFQVSFAFGAGENSKNIEIDEGVYVGKETPSVPLSNMMSTKKTDGEEKSADSSKLLGIETKKTEKEQQQAKSKLILTAEPGDGLISLTWKVFGVQQKPIESPPRFTLYYGTEAGRYDKKVEIGQVTDYKLRNLQNNQVYFIKVQGSMRVTQDTEDNEEPSWQELQLFSNEVRVIPLAVEDLGSALEKTYASKTYTLQEKLEIDPLKREIRQFGYDFFKNSLAAATYADSAPVGADYILGPGDSLRIDIWGSVQAHYEVSVDRNGEISIPKVGTIKIWGMGYGQAKDVINKAISRYFKGYELNVTLGKLRTIQVFVVGEVTSPGIYSISSTATVINALSLAGGPSKNGSLRAIRLTRNGKVFQEIDLYDMFLNGDRSKDVRLESGDTIFVPVIGPVAGVAGEVKRGAIFELKGKTSLPQLLSMAGGITAAGDTGRIQVERIEDNRSRIVLDFEVAAGQVNDKLSTVEVNDRDMIKVFPVHKALRQVAILQGNVLRPGEYQFKKGMRVSDIVSSFEQLLPDSYLDTAEINRLVPPDYHKETLSFNLRKAILKEQKDDLVLQEQDTIRIFQRNEMEDKPTVSVTGQVLNPGTYDYFPHMTVRELISMAGNLKRNAYLDEAELNRIIVTDGKAKTVRFDINLKGVLNGSQKNEVELKPDDALIVRGIGEWLESTDRFVTLKGEVKFPGTYSITKGERLSSVIKRAGGFTEKAYLKGAKFSRKSVQKEQQKRMDEVIARAEQDILKKQGELASVAASKEELDATKASLEGLTKSLEKLKGLKAEGRVVVRLTKLDEFTNSAYDLELLGGDALEVPQTSSVINVMGQIYNPTALVHVEGKDISFYLKKAGGPTRDAEEDDMYVIKADGSVVSRQQAASGIRWDEDSRRWTFGGFMSSALDPGDTLVVPQKLERTAWLRDIKDITTIVSQIALTAGTVLIGLR